MVDGRSGCGGGMAWTLRHLRLRHDGVARRDRATSWRGALDDPGQSGGRRQPGCVAAGGDVTDGLWTRLYGRAGVTRPRGGPSRTGRPWRRLASWRHDDDPLGGSERSILRVTATAASAICFAVSTAADPRDAQHHVAGEKAFVDYSGSGSGADPTTGEIREAEISSGASSPMPGDWTRHCRIDWRHVRMSASSAARRLLVPDI